jgi:transposase
MLLKDFPPWQTVYGYFRDWRKDGTLDRVHDALRERLVAADDVARAAAVVLTEREESGVNYELTGPAALTMDPDGSGAEPIAGADDRLPGHA